MSHSFDPVFDAFDGPANLARAIGVTTEHAVQMRRRGSIPPEHWPELIKAAVDRGISGLTFEKLLSARKARTFLTQDGTAISRSPSQKERAR